MRRNDMKSSCIAEVRPCDGTGHRPIRINYREGKEEKAMRFFKNLVKSRPPYSYKQIIYLYKDNKLKFLMPFEL